MGGSRASGGKHGFNRCPPLEIGRGRAQKSLRYSMGHAVSGTLESWIFPQCPQDVQTVAGANAIFFEMSGVFARNTVADKKVPGKSVARGRRIFVIHRRLKVCLGAARVHHHTSCAIVQEEGSVQDFLFGFFSSPELPRTMAW